MTSKYKKGIGINDNLNAIVKWMVYTHRKRCAEDIVEMLLVDYFKKNPDKLAKDIYGVSSLNDAPIRIVGQNISKSLRWDDTDSGCIDCRKCAKSNVCKDLVIRFDPTDIRPFVVIHKPASLIPDPSQDIYPTVLSQMQPRVD